MATDRFRLAITVGDLKAVNELLNNRDVNVDGFLYLGMTPLTYAIKCGFITDETDKIKLRRNIKGLKSAFGHDDIIVRLIDAGSDVHAKDSSNKTPLILALEYKRGYEVIRKLIDAGSDINLECKIGNTPLMYAVLKKYNKKLVDDFISMGANVNHTNFYGKTALVYAVYHNDLEIATILINNSASVHIHDTCDSCLLWQIPCKDCRQDSCQYKEIINLLLKSGVDLFETNKDGNTVIHMVNCNYLISLAVTRGVSIDAVNNDGLTPLMEAIFYSNVGKVSNLLSLGADCSLVLTSAFSSDNKLQYTHLLRSGEIFSLLYYYGANLCARNDNSKTLLDVVIQAAVYEQSHLTKGIEAFIKTFILFVDEAGLDAYFSNDLDEEPDNIYLFYFKCVKELNKLKITFMTDKLTFYQFCVSKPLFISDSLDILYNEYKYNYDQIKKLFPIYHDLIIMRIKDNQLKRFKKVLVKRLENVTLSAQLVDGTDSAVVLSYDCLVYLSQFLNYKDLYNLILSSSASAL